MHTYIFEKTELGISGLFDLVPGISEILDWMVCGCVGNLGNSRIFLNLSKNISAQYFSALELKASRNHSLLAFWVPLHVFATE